MSDSAIVYEWCGFCGAKLARSLLEIELRYVEPPCPRCGETDWRSEAEEWMLDEGDR